MTWWPAERVTQFARQAGWPQAELANAVAVALASSDGRDDVVVAVPPPPLVEYVGLWLVPATERSGRTVAELLDPLENARTARRLWLASGGDWSWSPTYQTGRWRWRLQEATQAVQRPRLFTSPSPLAALGDALRAGEQLRLESERHTNGEQ